jgi:hypothetical protein
VRSAPCTWRQGVRVSWLSLKTKVDGLSVILPQNHWDNFLRFGLTIGGDSVLRFGVKTGGDVFSCLASNLMATVSPSLASKPVVGFLVEPQNQGGGVFPSLDLKTDSYSLMIYASKSPQRFFGLGLKTKQA